MTSTITPVYRQACQVCQRPALTLDERGTPFCSRHAAIFIAAPTPAPVDDDDRRS